jgi:hypothetical protein
MAKVTSGSARAALIAGTVALVAAAGGFIAARLLAPAPGPRLEPDERLATTPVVLTAVRGLARLESVAYHMERVIDLKQRQPRLFGLIEVDDAILLVAAGDVIAGVDLAKMRDGDVTAFPAERRVQIQLPPPEILTTRLDNELTYVHSRKTDLLAERGQEIETRARQIAEESIRDAALSAGILDRARQSAEQTLTVLVRSLGYDRVDVTWSKD